MEHLIKRDSVRVLANNGSRAMIQQEFAKKYGTLIVLIALLLFNGLFTLNFTSIDTIWNIIIQTTLLIIVSLGLTFVIAARGIDISVGSTMALSSTISVMLMPEFGVIPGILIGLIAALIVGAFIGSIVVIFNVQPIVITLAMLIAVRSIARLISKAEAFMVDDPFYTSLAHFRLGGQIPVQVFYILFITIVFLIVARYTILGKYIEAIGNNRLAARIAGINVTKITVLLYMIAGFMAGMAGILSTARSFNSNSSTLGTMIELDAIAAVVIGGTSMNGGKSHIIGTVIGSFIITLVTVTVNMNNVPIEFSLVFKAVMVILAVFFQSDRKLTLRRKNN